MSVPPVAGRVLGLGADVVEVDRFRRVLDRRSTLGARLFRDGELAYASDRRDPVKSLAARFAAKEAAMKALGVGVGRVGFRDFEVLRDEDGAPSLALHGPAAALARHRGVESWSVSLSHTDSTAFAVAIALG
jgi:holo-[acyl-carrier protein] synthase